MSRRRPAASAWTPRLRPYDEDASIWLNSPFKEVLARYTSNRLTRQRGASLWQQLSEIMKTAEWVERCSDWLAFTLGGDILDTMPGDSLERGGQLFLEVTADRVCHNGDATGDTIAYQKLEAAQIRAFKSYVSFAIFVHPKADKVQGSLPTNYCFTDDINQRDIPPGASEEDEETWEEESTDESGDEYWEDIDEDDPDNKGVDVQMKDISNPPSNPPSAVPSSVSALVSSWEQNIQNFFFTRPSAPLCEAATVVDDLVAMQKLSHKIYNSDEFCRELDVNISPLNYWVEAMRSVCKPGNLIETSRPDLEESFRSHNWKLFYADLICRWVRPSLTSEQYDEEVHRFNVIVIETTLTKSQLKLKDQIDPKFKFKFILKDAEDLLKFFSDRPRLHPWSYDPMAVNMFMSLACFTGHAECWFVPGLKTLGYNLVTGWNSEAVYRALLQLPVFRDPEANQAELAKLHPKLALTIEETLHHRQRLSKLRKKLHRPLRSTPPSRISVPPPVLTQGPKSKSVKQGAGKTAKAAVLGSNPESHQSAPTRWHPLQPGNCPRCSDLPMEQQCIRLLEVEARDCSHLRLHPKPKRKTRKGAKSKRKAKPPLKFNYLHPFDDLNMELIEYRPEVFDRCGQDIVGGVRFRAFPPEILALLNKNHQLTEVRGIRRRAHMQAWSYGSMTPGGSRVPTVHQGVTLDDMRAVFRHASDVDILVEAGATIYPPMKEELEELAQLSDVNRLGRTVLSLFSCANYISAVHGDADMSAADLRAGRSIKKALGTLYPCVQLAKSGCSNNSYNFAYMKYGVVVQTQANTVCSHDTRDFNGREEHGTVMPSHNEVMNNAVAKGKHPTSRGVDIQRGAHIREVHGGYNLRLRVA
ncbi:hypothetical protein B0H14DRAFT_2624551 [Mycena olivaceomarginata]|nr:hypothetical protein B0H14DRAFT_2624551 [Mycena olivaceomarginata]